MGWIRCWDPHSSRTVFAGCAWVRHFKLTGAEVSHAEMEVDQHGGGDSGHPSIQGPWWGGGAEHIGYVL